MTRNQRANFKDMINKNIASQASAGSIIEEKEFELSIVNRVQDNFVHFLHNYNRTFITGGAGTGKTWIATKFAKKASLEGHNVLVVVHSRQLVPMFNSILDGYKNISVLTFSDLIKKDGMNATLLSADLFDKYDEKARYEKYETIIVDEAQDFDQYESAIISLHLKDSNSEFRVFYDKTQNIHDKDFKDGFDITYPEFPLKENLRNTASIYDWATEKTNLGKEEITNNIIGPMPVSLFFSKEYEIKKYIETEIIKFVDNDKISINNIVLIADPSLYGRLIGKDIGRWICNSTVQSEKDLRIALVEDFKGLEADIVFYLHLINTPENYNYVAYTRAKYYLYDLILK